LLMMGSIYLIDLIRKKSSIPVQMWASFLLTLLFVENRRSP
jgi:hypothetical protein